MGASDFEVQSQWACPFCPRSSDLTGPFRNWVSLNKTTKDDTALLRSEHQWRILLFLSEDTRVWNNKLDPVVPQGVFSLVREITQLRGTWRSVPTRVSARFTLNASCS